MTYLADLPAVLADWDLEVTTLSGAATRGSSSINPSVIVVHDDIIGGCPPTCPSVIPNGVQQPTQYVPGPLYNAWIDCPGKITVVACGTANNAGEGSWAGRYGNSSTIGLCFSHHPDDGTHHADAITTGVTACAALCERYDIDPSDVIGHKEWTTRKSDPWNTDMAAFRVRVREAITHGPGTTDPPQENDMIVYKLAGQPAVAAGAGSPGIVEGTVAEHRDAGVPVVELRSSRAGRAVYARARRENLPLVQRIFRTRKA